MQWSLEQFKGKHVVFVGAGKGRAMAGIQIFLEKHGKLASFVGVDKHDGDRPLDFLRLYDQSTTVFIKNEGIPGAEMPVPYMTAMQLFFSLVPLTGASTVGITGTKGKSTTTSLTAHILEAAGKPVILAGNIGVSPLTALDQATDQTVFVLELSSYQLSDLTTSPHVSACLNLYNDHSDWHGSLEKYWEAKHNIMRFAKADDVFIYNPSFPALRDWAATADCQTIAIDASENVDLTHAKLFGEHNRLNAIVARHIARTFRVPDELSQTAINSFLPLEHRMEEFAVKGNLTFIDDGIGMTPESTIASMKAIIKKYGRIGCMLLGGQDRNYEFKAVMRLIADSKVPILVLFPDTTEKMKAAMPEDYHPTIFETKSMREAVRFAAENAPKPSVVLLSSAAPSYSLWKDFEDKGNQFKQAVNELPEL